MSAAADSAEVSALIVAGGRATRMGGVDKRTLVVDGATIFERQIAVLAPRVAEILVSARSAVAGYRTVADEVPDAGPLAGIAAGLAAAQTPWLLVIAGDMPHVSGALVDALLAARGGAAGVGAEVGAVGVRIGERIEPLLCLLRVASARSLATTRLAAGAYSVQHFLLDESLATRWLADAALRAVDPELRALTNVNSPTDLDPDGARAPGRA